MSNLNKLYDPVIKAHQANPYHFKKIANPQFTVKSYNSLCGDHYDLYVDIQDGRISSIHFYGQGCAISMAAASVLAQTLEGKKIEEAVQLSKLYLDLLTGIIPGSIAPDEFNAFTAVISFPERFECATLVWAELNKFLQGK